MIIDAHAHLWKKQAGMVNGKPVYDIGGGKSDFGGEIKQMMPPYMTDGENTAERFLSNMDYAGVSGAVITQEYIDGNQDEYLLTCRSDRVKVCALYEEKSLGDISEFEDIANYMNSVSGEGDMLLVMGAGDITKVIGFLK